MTDKNVFCGKIPTDAIHPSNDELSARLNTDIGYTDEIIKAHEAELRSTLDLRYSAVKVNVSYPGENRINLTFGAFYSRSLYENLNKCRQAIIFVVTTGLGVDRALLKLSLTSPAGHFIYDALSSAYIEEAAEYINLNIAKQYKCKPRFSPGYGDLPLAIQPDVLNLLKANKLLGITIGKSLLMTPMKTITAIIGIEDEN